MKESPNVLVLMNFHPPQGKDRAFYASEDAISGHDFLNYVDTGSKEGLPKDFMAYAGNPEMSEGVFNENGLLDEKAKKEVIEDLRNTPSIVWDMVISLSEEFGKGN